MSDYDQLDERGTAAPPDARVKVRKWSPWIWIAPLLAMSAVGYLIVRYGVLGGFPGEIQIADRAGDPSLPGKEVHR